MPARDLVADDLLEQGIIQAHDHAASHLRFASELVDHETAILDGDKIGAANDSRLTIDQDFGDLHAADLAAPSLADS